MSLLFRIVDLPLSIGRDLSRHLKIFHRALPKKRESVRKVMDRLDHVSHQLDDSVKHTEVTDKSRVEPPNHI